MGDEHTVRGCAAIAAGELYAVDLGGSVAREILAFWAYDLRVCLG